MEGHPRREIPGTLNVGYALPTVVQGVIFMTLVEVEFMTLVSIIGAAVVGAYLGAGVVAGLPRRKIQIGMGTALLCAATLMVFSLLGIGPEPGVALGLSGNKLAIAVGCSVVLGALMMLGIGFYAPCMIMISLLGMDPEGVLPDHDGRVRVPDSLRQHAVRPQGLLRPARRGRPDASAAPLAVLMAAFIVKSLPLTLRALAGRGRRGLHRVVDDRRGDEGAEGEPSGERPAPSLCRRRLTAYRHKTKARR